MKLGLLGKLNRDKKNVKSVIVTRYVVTIMLKCTGTKQRFDDRTAKLSSEIIT